MVENFLNKPLELPCGAVIKNRLVKSAMTERISDSKLQPTAGHVKLYDSWADTGAGILVTGNVMVDRIHLESAGNVCFDDQQDLEKLAAWANAGKKNGGHIWVQISHAGRQASRFSTGRPLAPSEVQLHKIGLFGKPKAMTEEDILNVIEGFVTAARLAKKAGFTGIQVHAAHGYLINQFLSPSTNQRTDEWGGSLENRSRLLMTILRKVREEVGADFPLAIKLNSSDFQRGGFDENDSLEVIKMLDEVKLDLLEISGGTYEKIAFFMMNDEKEKIRESTRKREAYFIDFAKKVRSVSKIPLLITGGFRSFEFCNTAIEEGELDFVGMGRPFITDKEKISAFLKGNIDSLHNLILRTGIKKFDDSAEGGFYARQLVREAKGKRKRLNLSPMMCSVFLIYHEMTKALGRKLG